MTTKPVCKYTVKDVKDRVAVYGLSDTLWELEPAAISNLELKRQWAIVKKAMNEIDLILETL